MNKRTSPEVAFEQAKQALHSERMQDYLDALTEEAVLRVLGNSIFLCFGAKDPGVRPPPPSSPGCESIVTKHGYPLSGAAAVRATHAEIRAATSGVADIRAFAAELEMHDRRVGGGTSFSWGFLDDVTLRNVTTNGDTARGEAVSPDQVMPVVFKREVTGWRMELYPDA